MRPDMRRLNSAIILSALITISLGSIFAAYIFYSYAIELETYLSEYREMVSLYGHGNFSMTLAVTKSFFSPVQLLVMISILVLYFIVLTMIIYFILGKVKKPF